LGADDRAFVLARPDSLTELAILSGQPWHRVQRVLLIGCGNTGLAVAPLLTDRGLSVTIVESAREPAELAAGLVPQALVRRADGADPQLLRSAIEEERIDTVIVLLPEAEKSVLIGIFAKSLGAAKVVVRCDEPGYSGLATRLGVDVVLSPKRAMADAVLEQTRWSTVVSALLLGEHEVEIVQLEVPERPARPDLVTKPLKSLGFPQGSLVGAVMRGAEVLIGSGDTVLRPGDEVLIVSRPDALAKVELLLS
jgi:trk system potassium uptake protein TrkA